MTFDLFVDLPLALPDDLRKITIAGTSNPGPRPKDHIRLQVQVQWPPAVGTPSAARLNGNKLTHTPDPNMVTVSDASEQVEAAPAPELPREHMLIPARRGRGRPRKLKVVTVDGVKKPLPKSNVATVPTVTVAAHTGAVAAQTITAQDRSHLATLSPGQINKAFGGTGVPGRVIRRDATGNIIG